MKGSFKYFEIKYSKIHLILAIIIILYSKGISQTNKNKLSFNIGQSTFKADNRIDFLYVKVGQSVIDLIKNHRSSNDNEYFVNILSSQIIQKHLKFECGLGYSKVVTDIKLPVKNGHFNYKFSIFILSQNYIKHQFQIPLNIHYLLINKKSFSLSIGVNNYSNISFRKEMMAGNERELSVNNLNFSSFETYPTLALSMGPIIFKCEYRLWNFKYKDDALDNNGLTWDRYNPSKIRVGLGFNFFSF